MLFVWVLCFWGWFSVWIIGCVIVMCVCLRVEGYIFVDREWCCFVDFFRWCVLNLRLLRGFYFLCIEDFFFLDVFREWYYLSMVDDRVVMIYLDWRGRYIVGVWYFWFFFWDNGCEVVVFVSVRFFEGIGIGFLLCV